MINVGAKLTSSASSVGTRFIASVPETGLAKASGGCCSVSSSAWGCAPACSLNASTRADTPAPLAMSAPLRCASTYAPFPATWSLGEVGPTLRSTPTYAPFPVLKECPHVLQNLASSRFAALHDGQNILPSLP